jgi:hypothetical protein
MSVKERGISAFGQFERRVVRMAFNPLLRYELDYQEPNTASEIHELLEKNIGVTFWFNHFRTMDGLVVAHVLVSDPEIRKRRMAFPIAIHQYENTFFHPVLASVSWLARLEFAPIVIEDSLKLPKYKNRQLGEGLDYYFTLASDVLKKGGVVAINPQSGRRASLSQDTIAGRVFMTKMYRKGVGDYGIVPIGLGKKDTTSYAVEDLSLDPYTVKIGRLIMASDIFGDLSNRRTVLENLCKADTVIMGNLAEVVPSGYL